MTLEGWEPRLTGFALCESHRSPRNSSDSWPSSPTSLPTGPQPTPMRTRRPPEVPAPARPEDSRRTGRYSPGREGSTAEGCWTAGWEASRPLPPGTHLSRHSRAYQPFPSGPSRSWSQKNLVQEPGEPDPVRRRPPEEASSPTGPGRPRHTRPGKQLAAHSASPGPRPQTLGFPRVRRSPAVASGPPRHPRPSRFPLPSRGRAPGLGGFLAQHPDNPAPPARDRPSPRPACRAHRSAPRPEGWPPTCRR